MYLYKFNVYMFLKGWNISRLGQDPSHRLSGTLVFFPFISLTVSFNLYSLQDNALGMPTNPSALLVEATCLSQAKICWITSRYPHPATETVKPLDEVQIFFHLVVVLCHRNGFLKSDFLPFPRVHRDKDSSPLFQWVHSLWEHDVFLCHLRAWFLRNLQILCHWPFLIVTLILLDATTSLGCDCHTATSTGTPNHCCRHPVAAG